MVCGPLYHSVDSTKKLFLVLGEVRFWEEGDTPVLKGDILLITCPPASACILC